MDFNSKTALAITFFGVSTLMCHCSGSSPEESAPAWTRQPVRTVDNGYIVYVGIGEDPDLSRANFKAQSAALEDVANECSFTPKGARIEDQFDQKIGHVNRSFAKVGISYEDFEAAKRALQPSEIQALANVQLTEQVKRYQDQVDNGPEVAEESEGPGNNEGVNPAIDNTGGPPPIQGTTQFFIVRQQVAYVKEVVILSPPTAYPPAAPQTQQVVQQLTPASTQVRNYEAANPSVKTWNNSWSGVRQQMHQQAFRRMMRRQGYRPPGKKFPGNGGNSENNGQRRRRRGNWNPGP